MKLYELKQGAQSLGVRSFADTKAFVLKCCTPSLREQAARAKRVTTLARAIEPWGTITGAFMKEGK